MAIEYLEEDDQVGMPHTHLCDECSVTLIDVCVDDCDNDTYELCDNCDAEISGDNEEVQTEIRELGEPDKKEEQDAK